MVAFNVVRFRVKPGHEKQFIDAHRGRKPAVPGFCGGSLVQTGESTFCFIGEWTNFRAITEARPQMLGILDTVREHLEDLGGGLGLTDPVSGEAVVTFPATKGMPKKEESRPKAKWKKAKHGK
jgi:hypothetical protein